MAEVDTVDEPRGSVASSPRTRVDEPLDRAAELGPYRLLSVLGRGGMATVYRAVDARLGREVALKLLLPHLRRDRTAMKRFVQEARAVAKLRHESIVAIFDVSADDAPEPYLVVELVRGSSLREALRNAPPMAPELAAELVLAVLSALDHAHGAGIVHRDIKPENVLIDGDEREGACVKLADFGIAKIIGQQTVTNTGELIGSPAYMAPEQLEGAPSDERADVFAVGVLFYECIAGRRPFEGEGAAQVIRRIVSGQFAPADEVLGSIGARWSRIVAKALAHDREARYPSARAMADAIRAEAERLHVSPSLTFSGWLREPEATNEALAAAIKPELLASARAAIAAGDALTMAADVNRLLALFPADSEALALLMHRQRRVRMVRAVAGAAALITLGAAGVVIASWKPALAPKAAPEAVVVASVSTSDVAFDAQVRAPSPFVDAATAVVVAETAPDSGSSLGRGFQPSKAAASGALAEKVRDALSRERKLVVETLQPPFGVFVRIDDGETYPVTEGTELSLTAGKHKLHFACKADACIPQEQLVSPNEARVRVNVALRIRSARLRILAAPERRFQILESPSVDVRLGEDTEVPMSGSRATVHVVDLSSGRKTVAILSAGVVTTVSPE